MLTGSDAHLLPRHAHEGFSDDELVWLSHRQRRTDAGHALWATWEAENSSFGRTLREWTSYPLWLPLCASSDHGVHWGARCWPNEIESPYRLFLTWNGKKARLMRKSHGKQALHIPHPWVAYRKAHHPELDPGRSGTVVFFTHSNATTTPVFDSLDSYMQSLHDLPARFHPLVICLSFHDILKGTHIKLRPYGFPLVTAGTTNNQAFVDRFYSIAKQFRYACSPTIGSHSFYLVEAGVAFFLHGPSPTYVIKGSRAVKDGEQDLRDYGDAEDIERFAALHELFSDPNDTPNCAQQKEVGRYLGLDANIHAEQLHAALWQSFRRNGLRVATLYGGHAIKALRRNFPAFKK